MKNKLTGMVVILMFILPFFILSSFSGCKPNNINVSDSIINLQKVALPFEYEDWLNWICDYFSDKGVEDETRFVYHYIDSHTWLNSLYENNNDGKEITGFAHVQSSLFLILDNGHKDFFSFIVGNSGETYDCLKLINLNNNGEILSSMDLSHQDTTSLIQGFRISEDLKIELYEGNLVYNTTKGRGVIENRKILALYQVREDGKIIELNN